MVERGVRRTYMPAIMLRRLTAFLALFALGSAPAEAVSRGYPSLAKRPIESQDRTVPPPPPVEQAPADPALGEDVAKLGAQAASGDAAFQQQLMRSRAAVTAANGAAPTSEPWVAAQMAISVLDGARYDSVAALAGLDSLYVNRQNNADPARVNADLATITPVRAQVLGAVDAQNDALDALRTSLRQP